jgi:lipopolysaccharide export system protein LptA
MKQAIIILALLVFPLVSLLAEPISFSGGSTSMHMQQGFETITLSQGATITSGSLRLEADTIVLTGESFRYATCSGSVSLNDEERGISLHSKNLYYDRQEELIIIDGYLELDDQINEVIASAFHLEFALDDGVVLLQVQVQLFKHTDRGAMACKADSLRFNRDSQILDLEGNATIDWDKDLYQAQKITVDLTTEAITMEGAIKGVVNG